MERYRKQGSHSPKPFVRYRPFGTFGAIATSLFGLAGFFGFSAIGLAGSAPSPTLLWKAAWILSALVWLVPMGLVWRHARIEIDRERGTLTVVQVRWPLRRKVRTIPLARVKDAVVESDFDGDAARYSVELIVDGEAPVSLLGTPTANRSKHERVAQRISQIRHALHQLPAQRRARVAGALDDEPLAKDA